MSQAANACHLHGAVPPLLQVWACLLLMIISALLGGWTDLEFSLKGYAWQLINCCFTAAYRWVPGACSSSTCNSKIREGGVGVAWRG